jgi:hypothetical protein
LHSGMYRKSAGPNAHTSTLRVTLVQSSLRQARTRAYIVDGTAS